jgi:hypothetical protein
MKSDVRIEWEHLSNIFFEELDGNITDIQDSLNSIDYFSNPEIHIVKTHPGSGKSTAIKKQIKNLKKCLIITNSNKISDEEYKKPGLRIWKGFTEHPHRYKKAEELYSSSVPIGMICHKCPNNKKKNCSYKKQFINAKKVVAHYNYLDKHHIHEQKNMENRFKFENLVVDEDIWKTKDLKLNKEGIKEAMDVISEYVIYNNSEKFISNLDSMRFPEYEDDYFKGLNNIKRSAIDLALKNPEKDWEAIKNDLYKISKLNPYDIRKFFYYKTIYGDIESYPEPNLYYVFDIARQGVPVVLLDATFDEDIFQILFSRYCYEDETISRSVIISKEDLYPLKDIKTTFYTSNLKKVDANIYRMRKNHRFFNGPFFKDKKKVLLSPDGKAELKKFELVMKNLKRKYNVISIITTKDLIKELLRLKISDSRFIEQYWNLKGLNSMKDSDAIVLYGTPPFNFGKWLKKYNDIFLTDFKEEDFEKIDYFLDNGHIYEKEFKNHLNDIKKYRKDVENSAPNKTIKAQLKKNSENFLKSLTNAKKYPFEYKYKDKNFEDKRKIEFNKQNEKAFMDAYLYYTPLEYFNHEIESLIYQALMRARIYRREGTAPDIFMFCHVPDIVDLEFKLKYYDNKETTEFFEAEFKGIYPLVIKENINQSTSKNVTKIAKKLGIYVEGKKSLNVKLITAIKNNSDKNIKKIDEGLKNRLRKPMEFYDEYPALKKFQTKDNYSFNEFLKDCIYQIEKKTKK